MIEKAKPIKELVDNLIDIGQETGGLSWSDIEDTCEEWNKDIIAERESIAKELERIAIFHHRKTIQKFENRCSKETKSEKELWKHELMCEMFKDCQKTWEELRRLAKELKGAKYGK